MNKIGNYIQELLLNYPQVAIEHLGVLSKSKSFEFNKTNKDLSFQSSLHFTLSPQQKDDGMLSKYIAIREKISLTDAQILLKNFVEQLKIDIFNGNEIAIGNIGHFFLNEDQYIDFQTKKATLFAENYGIGTLKSKPIIRVEKTTNPKKSNKWMWASAVLIPLLGASLYFAKDLEYGFGEQTNYAGVSSSEMTSSVHNTLQIHDYLLLENELEEEEFVLIEENNPNTNAIEFQVVVGVFRDLQNAAGLKEQIESQTQIPIEIKSYKKGLYKVISKSFPNKILAKSHLKSIQNIQKGAWLLKVRN
ncbi:MAG: hypothetical protein N4A45_02070 [Flavobacteriales bacterium]|jgi:hypothetical protein|nr:hypothetical protein [Flavobacteriales bacterium]